VLGIGEVQPAPFQGRARFAGSKVILTAINVDTFNRGTRDCGKLTSTSAMGNPPRALPAC
jgi:hypothetical protein